MSSRLARTGLVATLLLGDVPLQPDRAQARAWAEQELLRPEYQAQRPGLLSRMWTWLLDRLTGLPHPANLPGKVGVAVAAGLLITLVCYVLWRAGGLRRAGRRGEIEDMLGGTVRTAAEHRAAADAALAAGDPRTAVLERFRGLIVGLQERALLDLEPGRTADEAARAAAAWLPDLAGELAGAAARFDDVRYGDRPAGLPAAEAMRDLDHRVQRTRPARVPRPAEPSGLPR